MFLIYKCGCIEWKGDKLRTCPYVCRRERHEMEFRAMTGEEIYAFLVRVGNLVEGACDFVGGIRDGQ